MRSWPALGFCFSASAGLFSWAADKVLGDLDWAVVIAFPLSIGGMAACGAAWCWLWLRERTRPSLPGFGVHMSILLHSGELGTRRYIFEVGCSGAKGAALYISASDRLTFVVRDDAGETYPLEVPLGRRGVPLHEAVYLAAEAGRGSQGSVMRIILDGQIIAERVLPFPVNVELERIEDMTMGASADLTDHGSFTLNNIALTSCTLSDGDARKMAKFQAGRTGGPSLNGGK